MEESNGDKGALSEMEWGTRQGLESAEYNEVLLRMGCIYRVRPEFATQEMWAFLNEVTYFTYESEREAQKKGLSLHPMTVSELRSLCPELG